MPKQDRELKKEIAKIIVSDMMPKDLADGLVLELVDLLHRREAEAEKYWQTYYGMASADLHEEGVKDEKNR